jgi:TolA-binding protein
MRTPIPLLLLAAACATTSATAPARRPQASAKLPAPNDLRDPAQRTQLADALVHARLGDAARDAGDLDRARTEWRAAGAAFDALGRSPASEHRMPFLAAAARNLLSGGDLEGAVKAAERLQADPEADAATRAVAARTRAAALGQIATAEVKAGRLDALSTAGADRRRGKAPEPRTPPETWRKLAEADDAYLASYQADPDPAAAENADGAAYQAALIAYSYDQLDEAARRFLAEVEAFPGSRYQDEASTLHLQTFLIRGDAAGHAAAIDRFLGVVGAQAKKAAEAARAGDAEAKARADRLARLEGQLKRDKQGLGFAAASRLLADGKGREAAQAYERFAADFPDHPDAPSALYNAAIAWTQVKEPKKALAAREQVLSRYPEARVAPKALLAAAGDLSAAGDHAGAARLYAQYLDKYPDGDDRCLAMLDAGAELDIARQAAEASRRYLAYGTDARCTKEDPNSAAKLLYRAAAIFNKAGNRPDTQAALKALAALPGVTDAQAKAYVEDARSRVK